MHDIEAAFRNSQLFSKEELILSFELMMEHIEHDAGYTKGSIKQKLELCNKFLVVLKKCKLPILTELYYFYDYKLTGNGIELNLWSAENLEVDEDGTSISTMSLALERTLLNVKCEYVTIDQFSKIQEVKPLTVTQWIHRGRLRNAKKDGDKWLIPSIEDKPSRGYESVQYLIEDAESVQIDEFPLVSMCDSIWIRQDDEDKRKFICRFDNYKTHFHEKMELSRNDVESIEFELISSGKAKPEGIIRWVPTIERNQE